MLSVLHFADAHIDVAAHGRHDVDSNLPLRVMDFLKALDQIVDTAILEKVDLVIFAGDAYRDRSPAPTYMREWGRRIMRLSQASITTLLLSGNHDTSPAAGRASTLQEFDTLQVPHIHLINQPVFLQPDDLEGLPVQVLALPWVTRSGMMAALSLSGAEPDQVYAEIEERLTLLVQKWLGKANPNLPIILTAHASVQGALYSSERAIMLGNDVILPGSLVKDPRLDYVALGHIHKAQELNPNNHPPVVYPGSIERVDFGETEDTKSFVIAHVTRGYTTYELRQLQGRRFIDRSVTLSSVENIQSQLEAALPSQDELTDAMVRLTVYYPHAWDSSLDEQAIRHYAASACEFHLLRKPQIEARLRLPQDITISSLSALELLELYWQAMKNKPEDIDELQKLASEILGSPQ
jgi:exonuclease SbcD